MAHHPADTAPGQPGQSPTPLALAVSEEKYRALIETTGTGYAILDLTGRVLDANPEYVRLSGHHALAEILGRCVTEWTAAHDRERNAAEVALCAERGCVRHLEVDYVDRAGQATPIEVNATVVGSGPQAQILTLCRDISARRRSQEALHASEWRYRTMVDAMEEAIHVVDRDLRIVLVNQTFLAWCTRLGLTAVRVGQQVAEAFPFLRPAVFEEYRRVFATGKVLITEETTRAGGADVITETRKIPVVEKGTVERVVTVVRDVTQARRDEAERRRLEEQVLQAQKLESLGVLAGGIAHDFNNLLMVILGHTDLALAEVPPGARARDDLLKVRDTSRRAADLCRQMLAYSGRGAFIVEPLDLTRLVRESAHMWEVSVSKKTALRYDLQEGLPAVEADAAQVRQVVMNLVMNASEALGDRGGSVLVRTCREDRREAAPGQSPIGDPLPPGGYVCLVVGDDGCGMDGPTRERMFDPFFTTKFAGRGLGLAVVRGVVRRHRGAVEVESEPGVGTTVRVLFPASGAPAATVAVANERADPWRGTGTVLLVDDEEDVRAVARRMLERCGFRVLTAADGHEALSLYARHAQELVCVLLDWTMPVMDGEQAFHELRRMGATVPVVIASGYTAPTFVAAGPRGRPEGFIEKPYDFQTLKRALQAALGGRPR